MIEVDLSGDSVGRIVFRVSPVHEVVGWLRHTASGARHPHPGHPSLAARRCLEDPDVALTLRLVGGGRTWADFVTPKPRPLPDGTAHPLTAQLADQLAEIAATPDGEARRQAAPHLAPGSVPERPGRHVARGLRVFADVAMTAQWPLVAEATARAVSQRADQVGRLGLARTLGDLHPDLTWNAGRLRIDKPWDERVAYRGEELVICPTAVEQHRLVVQVCSPDNASVIVPIRRASHASRAGAGPDARESALSELLGPSRARVLRALVTPTSTTELSHTLTLTKSTVAHHIRLLSAAGLLESERHGKSVLYRQSKRARDLQH